MNLKVVESIIAAFVSAPRKDRYLSLLETKNGVNTFRAQLSHFRDFEPKCVLKIPRSEQNATEIRKFLGRLGAPGRCFVVSESNKINGKSMVLEAALDAIVGHGSGSVISCLPGRLAYYEGEGPSNRHILFRNAVR